MDILAAKKEWSRISTGEQSAQSPDSLAGDMASSFMQQASGGGKVSLEYIDLLCEIAASNEPRLSQPAISALYGTIIEGLSDDFSSSGINTCNLVLTRVLSFVRTRPQGKEANHLLNSMGFSSTEELLSRYDKLRRAKPIPEIVKKKIRKIIILSRATIGADVAITSIIVHRAHSSFPDAELVLIAQQKIKDIFQGIPRVRFVELPYERHGTFFDRTTGCWPRLYQIVQEEHQGVEPDGILIFDPDTRFSQLGLLPLAEVKNTCYLNSRVTPPDGTNPSLSELTNQWLNRLLGENYFFPPKISLPAIHLKNAGAALQHVRKAGCDFIIAINLGIGKNIKKRIPNPFEEELLPALLKEKNTLIFLDSGYSSEGLEKMRALLAAVKTHSIPTDFITENELSGFKADFSHGVVGFKGSVGAIGAIISESDGFFGYDSMCQHLAAATQTPSVIVFAGAPTPRFLARWRPENSDSVTIIPVNNAPSLTPKKISGLVKKTALEMKKLRKIGRRLKVEGLQEQIMRNRTSY
ncbi:MAG: hypothetical protein U9O82_06470 [Thermodesulfobacteriota bacterium]|nr:hypothetical protein [Thermodesulfobacteriota bacterium]